MDYQSVPIRKITVSLPADLVAFADKRATLLNISRSQVIRDALVRQKLLEQERLAIEGYQFYTKEAEEFAATSKIKIHNNLGL